MNSRKSRLLNRKSIILAMILALLLAASVSRPPAQAQPPLRCQTDVIVQVDDWLSKLAEKFYGDVFAFPAIAQATNRLAAVDSSYAVIDNVDLIEPGWKLCIVDVATAETIIGFELENAPEIETDRYTLSGSLLIGAAHTLSGPLAARGQEIREGIELAVRDVNDSDLLAPARLELRWADTAGRPAQARAAVEQLITQEGVIAVLGPTLSRSLIAAAPVAEAQATPLLGSSNVVDDLTTLNEYIFRTSLPESRIISGAVQQAQANAGWQRAVIVYDAGNSFTRGSLAHFEQALAEAGVEVMATAPLRSEQPDFAEQLTALQTSAPDVVVLATLAGDAAAIVIEAQQAGLPPSVQFIGPGSLDTPLFFEAGGPTMEGILAGAAWNRSTVSGNNRQFVSAFTEAYSRPPTQLAAQSYAAVRVLAAALREANSTNPSIVRDALANVAFVETPLGLFTFDEQRNPDYMPVLQIAQDGVFVPVP